MKEEEYEHGVFCVRDDIDYASDVARFIRSGLFIQESQFELLATTRRGNKVLGFDFVPAGRRLAMRTTTTDQSLPLVKRMQQFIANLGKNYPRNAFVGARLLEAAGIPGAKPIAYWTYRPTFWRVGGAYLYEEAPGQMSVHNFRSRAGVPPEIHERHQFGIMMSKVVEIVQALHRHSLRHGKLALGNFLVNMDGERIELYLIDTHRVSEVRLKLPVLKRILDMNCLRRFDFDRQGRKAFLREYLGGDYSTSWLLVAEMWRLRGLRRSKFNLNARRMLRSALQPR